MAASHSIVSSFIISTQTFITIRILSIPKRICFGLRMILNPKRFLTSHKRPGYDHEKYQLSAKVKAEGAEGLPVLVQHGSLHDNVTMSDIIHLPALIVCP